MSLASSLVTFLKTKIAITNLVGSGANARIRANKLKQREPVPAIAFSVTGGEVVEHLGGMTDTSTVELELRCYGNSQEEADQLYAAVKAALGGYRGTMGDVHIEGVALTTFGWVYEDPIDASDNGAYGVIVSFSVVYSE